MSLKVQLLTGMRQKSAKYYMVNAQPVGWADIMAGKKGNRRLDDTQRTFMLGIGGALPPASSNTSFNANDILSQQNHRLYPQENNVQIAVHLDADAPTGTTFDVYTLKIPG